MKQTLLTKTIFSTILCAAMMQTVYASPTGRIFITNEKGNTVSVINGETLEVEKEIDIGDRPRGIGISPDGTEVYVASVKKIALLYSTRKH